MQIALDWIADYLSPVPAAQAAADALMNAGLPIESITDAIGAKGQITQVLDVEVTSNRTDCFSHLGLARELAALTGGGGGAFKPPAIEVHETAGAPPASSLASVAVEDPQGCPYYSARILRNLKVAPSPEWLVGRLESIGLRPVNNIVDITNYVLMELGQPLHAFDYDGLKDHQIIVRRARQGEKLLAIDAKEYPLDPSMLVIADARDPVALAGIMGGRPTEVTEKTTSILLESARFDPLSIRSTSRALGLKSDSSFRFERGLDPTLAEQASRRAAQLILQIAGGGSGGGGELASGVVAVGSAETKPLQVSMRLERFRQVVGISVAAERAMAILGALGFAPSVDANAGVVHTRVPSHRLDVSREVDLIEEIARVLGYAHVPTLDHVTHSVAAEPVGEKAARSLLGTLTEAGFSEAVTVTFIPESEGRQFLPDATVALIHPQHAGWKSDVLRPSLLPSLLAVRRTNQNAGNNDARVFEKGEVVVQPADPKAPPIRKRSLAAVSSDLSSLTALLTLLPDRLSGNHAVSMSAQPKDFPFFAKGASAEILLHSELRTQNSALPVGRVGLFTSKVQRLYDLRNPVAGIELDWDALLSIFTPVRRAAPVPRFPAITRDLSVVLDESIRWADIHAALEAANLQSLDRIDFVTTFRSKDIGPGKKSLTLTLEFRDPARTLKSEEVDAQVQTAIDTLARKFTAVLRA